MNLVTTVSILCGYGSKSSMYAPSKDMGDGEWRTIRGIHVFIKDGESPKQAFDRTLKEKENEQNTVVGNKKDYSAGRNMITKMVKDRIKYGTDYNRRSVDFAIKNGDELLTIVHQTTKKELEHDLQSCRNYLKMNFGKSMEIM